MEEAMRQNYSSKKKKVLIWASKLVKVGNSIPGKVKREIIVQHGRCFETG